MKPRLAEPEYDVVWDGSQRGTLEEALRRRRLGLPEPPPPTPTIRRADGDLDVTSVIALLEATAPRAYALAEIAAAFGVGTCDAWGPVYRLVETGLVERVSAAARKDLGSNRVRMWLYRLKG